MTKAQKKFLIGFGLVLALWHSMHLPFVQHAFLQFLAVGEVPGRAEPLSPQAVYLLLATIFSCSLVMIFRREIMRSLRKSQYAQNPIHRMRNKQPQWEEPNGGPIVIPKRTVTSAKVPEQKLSLRDRRLPALYLPPVMPTVWRFIDWEIRIIAVIYQCMRTIISKIWTDAVFGAKSVWQWAEPYIRRFDKHIEKELRRRKSTATILEIVGECRGALRTRRRTHFKA